MTAVAVNDDPLPPGAKFPLGRVVVTPAAAAWLPADVIARALKRHQSGDWGDISPEIGAVVARENDEGIASSGRLLSFYFKRGPNFSIVTAGDRVTTTVKMCWEWAA